MTKTKRRSRVGSAAQGESTTTNAPSPAALAAIEWPGGGFQWSDELRAELPIVRGIHAPPRVDGLALLDHKLLVLVDDSWGWTERRFAELAQLMKRPWKVWRNADTVEAISRERLMQPDREYWLELHAQALVGRDQDDLSTAYQYGGALPRVMHVCVALHGLPFVVDAALAISRVLEGTSSHCGDARGYLFDALRGVIAAADETEHDSAIAVLDAQAGSTPFDRQTRALVCPHRSDWVLQALADDVPNGLLLGECVMPPVESLSYLRRTHAHFFVRNGQPVLHRPLLLQIALHDEGAIDLMAHALTNSQGKRSLDERLQLAQRMHSPHMLKLLTELLDVLEVRPALDAFAQRWPAAVLKTAIEHALSSHSRVAEGWALRLALREPAALEAVMAALDEAARTRFAALLAEHRHQTAPDDKLPVLLCEPPWLRKGRQAALPTLALVPASRPDTLRWPPGEEARSAHKPQRYALMRPDDEEHWERMRARMQIASAGWTRVLAGETFQPGDATPSDYPCAGLPSVVFGLPDTSGLALWNSYPSQNWLHYGEAKAELMAVLAKWGPAAIPGFARYVQAHATEGLEAARIVDSTHIAPTALHALRRLKRAKPHAVAWLRAYPDTACSVAIPLAFGKDKPARDDAAFGLRWLVRNGFEQIAKDAAASYGPEAITALQALLDADPLLVLPARIPTLPSFFAATSWRRPELRSNGGALPIAAVEHIGTMLAISKLEVPYAGLDIVREACTPESLADFAWDLFEAWTTAGNPHKESWAFTALGLLGNDETARRLAPLIREWPRKGRKPLALTGMDVLAAIGSNVALMHLNGMVSKLRQRPLQDHAKAKIAAVAEMRGLAADELADRVVLDLGLDERGTLALDFGPQQFFVGFDEGLKPYVKDAQGTRLKDLPKPLDSDDAELAKTATGRWKQMKQDAKAVASLEVVRLEMCMVDRRRWAAKDFRLFFLEHPLMRHLAARLLWGVYADEGDDGALQAAFRVAEDWTLADAQDNAYTLPDDASVGIAHVLDVPKPLLDAFGQVFADYEILQPFRQIGRETYSLTDAERKSSTITRYEHKVVSTGRVMGLVNRGWACVVTEQGSRIGELTKRVGETLEVQLQLDPGAVVGDFESEPKQTLPGIALRRRGTWGQDGVVNFEQLHPIVASEVLRDVELLTRYREKA